ncbi:hypothetical protein C8J56DRAFT_954190 [Mycena floridula]|nr:hypothetical protein C8J56DRAFT_954190 [Mycena floridula]
MFKLRPSFIAFLWLLAAILSSGTITLNIPDHIFVEQIAVVHWIRGPEDLDLNFSIRTVPPSNMQAGTAQTIGLRGTITLLFHESPPDQILLDLFDIE